MNDETKKKRGRPIGSISNNPASVTIPRVRVTPEKLTAYKQAAKDSGSSFSEWVRRVLDKAAK